MKKTHRHLYYFASLFFSSSSGFSTYLCLFFFYNTKIHEPPSVCKYVYAYNVLISNFICPSTSLIHYYLLLYKHIHSVYTKLLFLLQIYPHFYLDKHKKIVHKNRLFNISSVCLYSTSTLHIYNISVYTQHQFTFPCESYRHYYRHTWIVCAVDTQRGFPSPNSMVLNPKASLLFFGVTCKQITNTLKPRVSEYRVLKAVC